MAKLLLALILWAVTVTRDLFDRVCGIAWTLYDFADALIERVRWAWRGEGLTDRAQLLKRRFRTDGDHCGAFRPGRPGAGDCQTDGHYLCVRCDRMTNDEARDRGLIEVPRG